MASPSSGDYLAATGDARVVPIVNLQCDIDHPTQTLADLNWLRESFPLICLAKVKRARVTGRVI